MKHEVLRFTCAVGLVASVLFSAQANADLVAFHFTGRLTVAGPDGSVIGGGTSGFTPISADLTLDTAFTGDGLDPGALIGSSTLNVTMSDFYMGAPATFHDMTLSYGGSGVVGNVLVDWSGNYDMPLQIDWNVDGLVSALGYGLEVGDTISGDVLKRDTDGDGLGDTVVVASLGSATPYADSLDYAYHPGFTPQGAAPMAATGYSAGMLSGPFQGIRGYIDIGSGNSMTVTSITAVPEPATWASLLAGLGVVALSVRRRSRTLG